MLDDIKNLLNGYAAWLKDNTAIREVDGWVEITTPHVDRHGDLIQIYAKRVGPNELILMDDGYTIRDLEISGCEIKTPKRKALLDVTLRGFGVSDSESGVLSISASNESFPYKKHCLLQAMLAVNDLFYLASPIVQNLFVEDVRAWLAKNDIRFVPRAKFTGRSGYDHWFDFVIPASRKAPERFLQTINKPTKENAENLIFAWMDTEASRVDVTTNLETSPSAAAFAVLNDTIDRPAVSVLEALKRYHIKPVMWSDREGVVEELAA